MKIIDKRGRLFGKVNILDIIIILIIIFACYFVFKKVLPKRYAGGPVNDKTITYQVEIQNVGENVYNAIKKGDKLYDSVKGSYLGVLKDFSINDYIVIITNQKEGKFQERVIPNKKTIMLTIEGKGYENDTSMVCENRVVKIGKKMYIKGKGYAGIGFIYDVKVGDDNE